MGKIEKQNKININAYVYNGDGKYVSPIRNSKEAYDDTLNVLLIERERQRKNINSIMFISKISIVLIIMLINTKIKNTFVYVVCNLSIQKLT